MPYSSDQQRKWAHTEAGKKALGGEAAVHEWDEATKGKNLPKYAKSESLTKFGGMGQLSLKEGGSAPRVKIPRQKHSPGIGEKPSKFFAKSEDVQPKHPNLQKLKAFMVNSKSKRQS